MTTAPSDLVVANTSPWLANAWHPAVAVESLGDQPVRVTILGVSYVVVRLTPSPRIPADRASGSTNIAVFADRCPHRNARLSQGVVVDGCLRCPYHGWTFSGDGSLVAIPALGDDATLPSTADLTSVASTERYGFIWIAPSLNLESPPIPSFDEWDDPTLTTVWLPSVTIGAGAAQFIDNFLDFAHFPFVHAGTFGAGESPLLPPYAVTRSDDGWGAFVDITHSIANHEDPLVATGEHALIQPRRMRFTYGAPFIVMLRLDLPVSGVVNAILTFCTPVTEGETLVHTAMLRNDIATADLAGAAVDYELAVMAEDLVVIENLPDRSLDLRPSAQAHTRADRITVEYRRILAGLARANAAANPA